MVVIVVVAVVVVVDMVVMTVRSRSLPTRNWLVAVAAFCPDVERCSRPIGSLLSDRANRRHERRSTLFPAETCGGS